MNLWFWKFIDGTYYCLLLIGDAFRGGKLEEFLIICSRFMILSSFKIIETSLAMGLLCSSALLLLGMFPNTACLALSMTSSRNFNYSAILSC
jgi:hypothetical protein